MITKNKLVLSIIVLAVFFGGLGFWYYQKNIYSKEILKLEILGPEEAEMAQEIEYTIKYKNNGNIRLEEPRLFFEYPEYSIVEDGENQKKEFILEDIYPGEERTIKLKARLLGKEGETKEAKAWLSYLPKNLTARYESETSHTTQIKSVPINFEFDLPSTLESGEEISFRLNYFSNVNYPLSDLGIRIESPSDFELKSATPKPIEETEWEIGLLNKAEGGRIEIIGSLRGEIGEEKNFKAELGSWQDGEFVVLRETVRAVKIITPSLYISQDINGNPQYVSSPGDTLHYEIFFKNIGDEDLSNLFLVARLEGKAFDFETLKAPYGEFESGDNSVVFDWRRVSKLQLLKAQEEGKVEFWIDLKEDWGMKSSQDKNPVVRNKVYLSQAWQEFTTKVNSKLEIFQKGYFEEEVFGNLGPIPPEVGQSTTYTIIWQAKNYYNDVESVRVKAVLGNGVKPTGKIFPENSRLTFDSASREIVWEIENMEAGEGILNSAPSVAFQVSLTPLSYQSGQTPQLISSVKIEGEDSWTGIRLEGEDSSFNTALPDDDTISFSEGVVQ
ncbi:MAG: hypothetical protein ABH800_00285 [Candidatus Nealsonbacteria bacterium]